MTDPQWGTGFDPDRLARLELRAWKAYYRREPAKLFGLLVMANHEQAHVSWPRALARLLRESYRSLHAGLAAPQRS